MNDELKRKITPMVQADGQEAVPEFLTRSKEQKKDDPEFFQSAEDVGSEDPSDVKK